MFRPADYRAKLLKTGTREVDPLVDHLLQNPLSDEVKLSIEAINKDKIQRMYVESCLLATANLGEISEVLEIPESILMLYRDIYYDVCSMTKLQKLSIISSNRDASEQQMKMWALSQGMEFIKWRIGKKIAISPVEGLSALFSDAFYKSKEAFFNPNSSVSSREALRWAKQSVDIAKLLKTWVADSEEAMKDIELALEKYIGDDIQFPTLDQLIEENNDESNGGSS